jgi:hypothetical protein
MSRTCALMTCLDLRNRKIKNSNRLFPLMGATQPYLQFQV